MLQADILQNIIDCDTSLLLTVNGNHNGFLDTFMYLFSDKLIWVPLYVAIFYVMLRNMHWKQLLCCALGVALVILLADQICSGLIRPNVERWRPSRQENPINDMVHIVNGYRGGRYGFPSCHAANTAGLAMYVFLLFRQRWLTIFMILWSFVTCYSRAYLGVHYPGDLLVGVLVGVSAAAFVYWILRKYCHYQINNPVKKAYAPIFIGGITILSIILYAAFF